MNGPSANLARQAAAAPYLHRLSPDTLRTIRNVWVCASAARYGRLVETGWVEDPDAYSEHDASDCEADDGAANLVDIEASAGTMPLVNLRQITRQLDRDLQAVARKLAVTYSRDRREAR